MKKKIRVDIKTRGKFATVYCGFCMKTALGIKNMLKRQDPRIRTLTVVES